jgi:hypothetical protein
MTFFLTFRGFCFGVRVLPCSPVWSWSCDSLNVSLPSTGIAVCPIIPSLHFLFPKFFTASQFNWQIRQPVWGVVFEVYIGYSYDFIMLYTGTISQLQLDEPLEIHVMTIQQKVHKKLLISSVTSPWNCLALLRSWWHATGCTLLLHTESWAVVMLEIPFSIICLLSSI